MPATSTSSTRREKHGFSSSMSLKWSAFPTYSCSASTCGSCGGIEHASSVSERAENCLTSSAFRVELPSRTHRSGTNGTSHPCTVRPSMCTPCIKGHPNVVIVSLALSLGPRPQVTTAVSASNCSSFWHVSDSPCSNSESLAAADRYSL